MSHPSHSPPRNVYITLAYHYPRCLTCPSPPPPPPRLFRGPFEDLVSEEDEGDEEEEEEDAKSEVRTYGPQQRERTPPVNQASLFVEMLFSGTVTFEGAGLVSLFFCPLIACAPGDVFFVGGCGCQNASIWACFRRRREGTNKLFAGVFLTRAPVSGIKQSKQRRVLDGSRTNRWPLHDVVVFTWWSPVAFLWKVDEGEYDSDVDRTEVDRGLKTQTSLSEDGISAKAARAMQCYPGVCALTGAFAVVCTRFHAPWTDKSKLE